MSPGNAGHVPGPVGSTAPVDLLGGAMAPYRPASPRARQTSRRSPPTSGHPHLGFATEISQPPRANGAERMGHKAERREGKSYPCA